MTKQDKCRELHEREVGTLKEQEALMGLARVWLQNEPATHPYFKVSKSKQIKRKIKNKRRMQ
nr:MAG TPA: hypothetical protein [Caudoviricetes sp.]